MFVTCATSQGPMATLKVEVHGAPYTRYAMFVTAPVSHAEMWPCAASALDWLPHHSASAPCRLLLSENEVGATTTGREKSRPSSLEPVLVGFEDGGRRCPARRPSRHFAAPPVLTWATRPKQRGAQLSPRGPATHTGLACSNGEAGRSGSTAPIDCASRGAELRCVASSASKGRLLGRTGSLARAHASVLRSVGIRRSASPAGGWSGIDAVVLTVQAAAEGRIVSAVSQRASAVSKRGPHRFARHGSRGPTTGWGEKQPPE